MSTESINEQIAQEALKWLRCPSTMYKGPEYGQDPDQGFDCSGFVKFVLERCSISVQEGVRHVREFLDRDFGMFISWGAQQRGDLVIFPRARGLYAGHIGIMLDEHFFIHAQGKDNGRVLISGLYRRRIENPHPDALYRVSPIGFKRIQGLGSHWKKVLNYWEGR